METELVGLLEQIVQDRGVPRTIKVSLEETMKMFDAAGPAEEKLASILAVLDEASGNPNVSVSARTHIWNALSVLENMMSNQRI